ncbi:MAG: hypothetical protein J6Z22_08035, partial [Lachnospiraceae bacterium]|nr:hypothetical protein [Lachnospiraceae bacterium]
MSGVKCTSKLLSGILILALLLGMTGCGHPSYELPYSVSGAFAPDAYGAEVSRAKASSFASDLCVVAG